MKIYRCKRCGSLVVKVNGIGCSPSCCGVEMEELVSNVGNGTKEKHIPAINREGNMLKVEVGSVIHPMEETHYIEWIALLGEENWQIEYLKPGSEPKALFKLPEGEEPKEVLAYCNLHGLYSKKL